MNFLPYVAGTILTGIFVARGFIKQFYSLSGLEVNVVENANMERITHKWYYIYTLFTYITSQ